MFKRIFLHPITNIILGAILGAFSKYGDIAYSNTFSSYFGLLSSGILMWLVLCSLILCLSESRKKALISVFLLMLSMLISYYLFSYFVVKYIYVKIIVFWVLMLIASLIAAFLLWKIRQQRKFTVLFFIASVFAIIYDAFFINSFQFEVMIPEIILAFLMLVFLRKIK